MIIGVISSTLYNIPFLYNIGTGIRKSKENLHNISRTTASICIKLILLKSRVPLHR